MQKIGEKGNVMKKRIEPCYADRKPQNPFLFTSACALKREADLEENEKRHECTESALGTLVFCLVFWMVG